MYSPLQDGAARLLSTGKVPIHWPTLPSMIPHRLRRRFRSTRSKVRSRQSPTSSITKLETSFSPADTLTALRAHRWSFYDGQYLLLAIIGVFALSVIQVPGAIVKTAIAALLLTSLIVPVTRQFFLPFLPIIGWLIFFYAAQYVSRFPPGPRTLRRHSLPHVAPPSRTPRLQTPAWRTRQPTAIPSHNRFSVANAIIADSLTAITARPSGSASCPRSRTSSTAPI